MLLKNKNYSQADQNWSVVLKPIKNEIDKKKIVQSLTSIFPLSTSEATDLVVNTPIILLDNLTQLQANRFRDFFSFGNQFLALTNDVFYKRRCYKTVWPDAPDLSFLNRSRQESVAKKTIDREVLSPDDALDQIKGLANTGDSSSFKSDVSETGFEDRESEQEVERWKRECAHLRLLVDRLQEENAKKSQSAVYENKPLRDSEKEIKDLKAALSGMNEKYEALREEYREVRSVLEGKLMASQKATESWQNKLENIQKNVRELNEEKNRLHVNLEQLRQDKASSDDEKRQFESKYSLSEKSLQNQIETAKKQIEEYRLEILQKDMLLKNKENDHQKQHVSVSEELTSLRSQLQVALSELRESHRNVQAKTSDMEVLNQTILTLKSKNEEIQKLLHQSAHEKNNIENRLNEALKIQAGLAENHQRELEGVSQETGRLREAVEKLSLDKQKLEEERRSFDREVEDLEESRELVSQALRELELQYQELVKKYGELRLEFEKNQKLFGESKEAWSEKEKLLSGKLEISDKDKEHLERILGERAEQVALWREKYESIAKQYGDLKTTLEQERENTIELSQSFEAAKKECGEALGSLDSKQKEIDMWREKLEVSSKKLLTLEELCTQQSDELQKQNTVLEMREKELDAARKQSRYLQEQLEQRELVQKRIQLTSQLAEKENQLKLLVKEQERVEGEIREREESIRKVLAEQEILEREIVEAKQSQRHLMEQVKREKNHKGQLAGKSVHENEA